jgi:hypothetical protein
MDTAKDPRLPQLEADAEAYMALIAPAPAPTAEAPADPAPEAESGGRPDGANRGGLMPAGE